MMMTYTGLYLEKINGSIKKEKKKPIKNSENVTN